MKNLYLLIILITFSNSIIAQKVLKVPLEYSTIQAGIDAAWDGDTVLVADGEYSGNGNHDIHFFGKRITVKSENGPTSCIINLDDADGWQSTDFKGFIFSGQEDSLSVLEGIQIINAMNYAGNYEYYLSNGVYVENSSPKIVNCDFNRANLISVNGSPTILKCNFHDFVGKASIDITWDFNSQPTRIINCSFKNNISNEHKKGVVSLVHSDFIVKDCVFDDNYHRKFYTGSACIYFCGGDGEIEACNFLKNRSENSKGCCVRLDDDYSDLDGKNRVYMKNCILNGNTGKKAMVSVGRYSQIFNCTFFNNTCSDLVGGVEGGIVKNCILYHNLPQESENSTISYSLIRRGHDGEGNFEADPLFVNPDSLDFRLQANSPCIDAGDPDSPLDPDGTRADIGAIPYNQNATFSNKNLVNNNTDIEIYPNPTSDKITINSAIHEILSIFLFTLDGRCLMVKKEIGSTKSSIDLKQLGLTKGVFLLKIDSDSESTSRKIVLN